MEDERATESTAAPLAATDDWYAMHRRAIDRRVICLDYGKHVIVHADAEHCVRSSVHEAKSDPLSRWEDKLKWTLLLAF